MTKKQKKVQTMRQGDVILIRVGSVPPERGKRIPREQGRVVLAHGEVTGHSHAIRSKDATFFETAQASDAAALALGTRLLVARRPVKLEHEEHGTVEIPAGDWLVRIQREYHPEELRNVAD